VLLLYGVAAAGGEAKAMHALGIAYHQAHARKQILVPSLSLSRACVRGRGSLSLFWLATIATPPPPTPSIDPTCFRVRRCPRASA
jgi:hypothetical protein